MSANDNEFSMHIEEHERFEETDQQADAEPARVRVLYDVNGKPKPYFDPKYTYIFYTWLDVPDHLLKNTPIIVKKLTHHNFNQMMDLITTDIQDKDPKMLTVACFDKMIPRMTNSSIMDGIHKLFNLVNDGGVHYISAGSQLFIPNHPEDWFRKAQINAEIRALNIDNNIPPLGLHKCLMTPLHETYGPLTIQGKMWSEFLDGTGLGSTLSPEGYKKIAHFVQLSSGLQFEDIDRQPSQRYIGLPTPPRLCVTKDYSRNETMCQILQDRGLFNVRPLSTSSLPRPVPAVPAPAIALPAPVIQQHNTSDDEDVMEDVSRPVEDNYNESGQLSIAERIERRYHRNETVEELKTKLRNLTLEKLKSDGHFKRQIQSLKNDVENYQASEDNQVKKIDKYKDELKRLKTEKEKWIKERELITMERVCQDSELKKVQKQLVDVNEKFEWLQGNYDFLKKLHAEKSQLLSDEWITLADSMKKAGVNLGDHIQIDDPELAEAVRPTEQRKKSKKKRE